MGEAVEVLGVEADLGDEFAALGIQLVATNAAGAQRRGDDLGDPLAWVERGLRVLEDHLHLVPHGLELAAAGSA